MGTPKTILCKRGTRTIFLDNAIPAVADGDSIAVNDYWLDVGANPPNWKRCTSIGPVVWADMQHSDANFASGTPSAGQVPAWVSADARVWTTAAGSGDVVGPAASIDSEVVLFSGTSGKLLKRATGTGFATVISGVLAVLTGTVVTALLDVFTSALQGLVPPSGGGTSTFLRADGTFAAPTAGGDLALSKKILAADFTITADQSARVARRLTINSGIHLTIGSGGSLEVTA